MLSVVLGHNWRVLVSPSTYIMTACNCNTNILDWVGTTSLTTWVWTTGPREIPVLWPACKHPTQKLKIVEYNFIFPQSKNELCSTNINPFCLQQLSASFDRGCILHMRRFFFFFLYFEASPYVALGCLGTCHVNQAVCELWDYANWYSWIFFTDHFFLQLPPQNLDCS